MILCNFYKRISSKRITKTCSSKKSERDRPRSRFKIPKNRTRIGRRKVGDRRRNIPMNVGVQGSGSKTSRGEDLLKFLGDLEMKEIKKLRFRYSNLAPDQGYGRRTGGTGARYSRGSLRLPVPAVDEPRSGSLLTRYAVRSWRMVMAYGRDDRTLCR